jgi:HAD superfamily hydrolase (TIGR01509 family)
MSKKSIIFDLDGTLVDAKELHHAGFEWAVQQQKDFILNETYRVMLEGLPTLNKVERLNSMGFNLDPDLVYQQKQSHTNRNLDSLEWNPEIPELLEQLSERYNLGLASNARSRFVFNVVELMGLHCFDIILTANYAPMHLRKPNPWMFTEVMRLLDSAPKDTIILEDSPTGLAAAEASGAAIVIPVLNSNDTANRIKELI